ncbi:MAG: flagellar biosynthetic protein FliQ, partial [Mailhella sp.]|nr:flagellar biosynthetic protein FliQ [Mailhella sp.]
MHTAAMEYASQALYLVLIISLPPILIASVIGILLRLIQAVTQLLEQSLSFGVLLIAVVVSIF